MICLIHGPKGSGKTKRIIDEANASIDTAKGSVIYITDKCKHSKELGYKIRFVDTAEYEVNNDEQFLGFVKGILVSDNDIENIYIDGLTRMTGKKVEELEAVYAKINELGEKTDVKFILTVSCAELPAYLKQFA